jgi:hypothetical protein
MCRQLLPARPLVQFTVAVLASALYAQAPEESTPAAVRTSRQVTRVIPALSYGPNAWSILRLTNRSASVKPVRVDVFRQNGERLPIGPNFNLNPNEPIEIRIEAVTSSDELCWAAVTEYADESASPLSVRAFLEVLNGNQIEDFEREIREASDADSWVIPAAELRGRSLYFLNSAETATVISVCNVKQARKNACWEQHRPTNRFLIEARQAMLFNIGNLDQKYLMIESSRPGSAVMVALADEPGRRRVFSAQSSIDFGRH